jgi:hypothetical protein
MADESVFSQWKSKALGEFLDINEYWKQRRQVLAQPELIFDDPDSTLKIAPLAFAIRGLLLLSVAFALATWCFETFFELPPEPIDQLISESKRLEQEISNRTFDVNDLIKAQGLESSKDLLRLKKIQKLELTFSTLVVPISLTLTAYLFARFLSEFGDRAVRVKRADRAYLYWVTARLFYPNIILVAGVQSLTFGQRFVSLDWVETLNLLSIWLKVICCIWGLIVLRRAAPELARLLGLPEVFDAAKSLRITANRLVASTVITNACVLTLLSVSVKIYAIFLGLGHG